MRNFRKLLALTSIYLVFSCIGMAGEFSKPTNTVGDANCFGELQFTSHFGSVQFARGEKYSLYYTYSSSPEYESPHLGKGFFVPLLEAVLIDQDYFLEATTMGGATIYMYRLPADPDQFVSLNGKNKATKLGENRYIRETEEGFKFEYRLGRLVKATSPKGIGLLFEYDGDICKSIVSSSGGQVVTYSKRSETDVVLTTASGRGFLKLIKFPISLEPSLPKPDTLQSFKWPDGNITQFDYSMPEETRRNNDGNDLRQTNSRVSLASPERAVDFCGWSFIHD